MWLKSLIFLLTYWKNILLLYKVSPVDEIYTSSTFTILWSAVGNLQDLQIRSGRRSQADIVRVIQYDDFYFFSLKKFQDNFIINVFCVLARIYFTEYIVEYANIIFLCLFKYNILICTGFLRQGVGIYKVCMLDLFVSSWAMYF